MAKSAEKSKAIPRIAAVCAEGSQSAAVLAALGDLFDPQHRLECHADLTTARSAVRRGVIVVPVEAPHTVLARAIEAGSAPSAALARWMPDAKAALAAARSSSRVVLVEATALAAATSGALATLCATFEQRPATDPSCGPRQPGARPVALVLAVGALATDPDAQALAADLNEVLSGSAPQDAIISRPVLDQVALISEEARLLRADLAEALDRTADGADGAEAEIALLHDGLAQTLEELEALDQALNAAQGQIGDLSQQVADRHLMVALNGSLENQLAELRRTHSRREAVLGTLVLKDGAVLHARGNDLARAAADHAAVLDRAEANAAERDRLAQEVERLQAEIETQAEALAAQDAENQTLRSELEKIYTSKSWKVTAPMRGVRRGISGSDKS